MYIIRSRGEYFGGWSQGMPTWVGKGSAQKCLYQEAVHMCYILGTKFARSTDIVPA